MPRSPATQDKSRDFDNTAAPVTSLVTPGSMSRCDRRRMWLQLAQRVCEAGSLACYGGFREAAVKPIPTYRSLEKELLPMAVLVFRETLIDFRRTAECK